MFIENTNRNYAYIGKITCWLTSILGIIYLSITIFGFISLNSPNEPIGDPYFSLMELLTLIIAPLMVIDMIAIHHHASAKYKLYSLFALCSMSIMAVITSSVHFVVLTMSHRLETSTMRGFTLLFSFKWPSVAYILDILAWDWFFSIGIAGVPFGDMQIRNIGIIGYAIIAPFAFLFIGRNFNRIHLNGKKNFQQV